MERLVRRIHHCAFRTRDVEAAAARWALLYGLTPVAVTPERALLRCSDEDYGLELLRGDEPGHDHTAYELVQGLGLDELERHLAGRGVDARRETWPFGHSESVQLTDAAGFGVELVEYVAPADRRPFEAKWLGRAGTASGHHPRKMGHVNVLCEDARALAAFYTSVLGFGVSDWIGDGAVWLHVDHDHHVFAALEKPVPHFHHVAFEVVDIAVMRAFLDHLAQHDRWVTWGPGRHAMARNLFSYVRMAEEDTFVELYCDMELLRPDHEPRQWPDDVRSSNAWGTLPPGTYFRYDDEAIRIEREQLSALGREVVA
jgi:catechol-2,3-dioxygenase